MNARVFLLVLVTGLFMAAWDGDQAAMEAAIVRRDARIANARIALLENQNSETQMASVAKADEPISDLTHSLTVAAVTDSADASVANAEGCTADVGAVPLPHSIAAGIYQAINQSSGATIRVHIDATAASSEKQRDFYTTDDDNGNRWYLIRIAADGETQL